MNDLIAILGPTASGKSEIALRLATELGGEILSVDSMQVYRGMDVGTAKPSIEERHRIVHHMIDVVDAGEDYSVAEFQRAGRAALATAIGRDVPVIIVGGSGLHFRALVDPLEFPPSDPSVRAMVDALHDAEATAQLLSADPEAGDHVDLGNPRRVQRAVEILRLGGAPPSVRAASLAAQAVRAYRSEYSFVALGLDSGEDLRVRAGERMDAMFEAGLLDEVTDLMPRLGRNAGQAVGYKDLIPVSMGELDLATGRQNAIDATERLAKRQRTFFRRDPRIRWLPWSGDSASRYRSAREVLERTSAWIS